MANLLSTTVNGSLLIGPSGAAHAYNGAATGKLYFGNQVSDSPTHYHITTNMEDYNGNYSKLDFRWYTGQRFYAHFAYGGFRFYEITTNAELFSVGKGDAHVRVDNNLYVGNTIYNNGNPVVHTGGGQTIGGTTYFSGGESLNLYGIRGRFTNEYIHLYNKVGIGHPGGWGQGEGNTPAYGLSTYGGATIAYANSAGMTVYGSISTDTYVYTNAGVRVGEIWGYGGIYRSSGSMLFGVEGGAGWSFRAANTEKLFIGNDGNIYMDWAGAYISTLLDAKQNASTAINTGNIADQSVSNATSADSAGQLASADATQNYGALFKTNDYSTMTFFSRAWADVQGANGLAYNFTTHSDNGGGGYGALQIYYGESGYVYAPTSFRAPIFYDSADTGYYVDPNSTSRLYHLQVWNNFDTATNDVYANMRVIRNNSYTDGMYIGYNNVGNGITRLFGGTDSAPLEKHPSYTYEPGSFRAPIFYDSQDTNYYVDPNGTSALATVYATTLYPTNTWVSNAIYFGGGNNYLNWTNNRIFTNVDLQAADVVSSNGIFASAADGGRDCYLAIGDGNPTEYGVGYGGTFTFYGDTSSASSILYAGGGTFSGHLAAPNIYQNNKKVRDSAVKTTSGLGSYYPSGNAGWYTVAKATLTSNCGNAVIYGTLYDHRYNGADAYQISVVFRAECDFTSNNESHYVNVGCTILGSTYISNYQDKIRLVLSESSTNLRTYELQFYETPWNFDTWQLESDSWTVYETAQAPRSTVGAERINYISHQSANIQVATSSMYAPIYYDRNDTNYYLDPNSTSRLYVINDNGGSTYNTKYFYSNKGSGAVLGDHSGPSLQAFSDDGGTAFMSFHRGSSYAVNFGLDPDNVIRIGGWSASANRMQLDMSGNVTFAGDVTAYSDARIKTNVQTIENALDKTLKLRGVTYNRTDSQDISTKVGVIAQEILEVIPEVVNQDASGMYNVSYGNLTAVLIEAIKEQQKQIDELKEIINGLTK